MMVLGIDPGYGRCGYGVIEGEKSDWSCVTHGVITTPANADFDARLKEIADDLTTIIDAHQPSTLVIEELFFAKSTTTALNVAEVRGAIRLIAAQKGLEVIEVKPNEVKMAVTGYGKADKQQMQEMIKTIFGFNEVPKPDDAADALAVAWTGAARARFV